jgi:DNA-binding NtrC family response regulator
MANTTSSTPGLVLIVDDEPLVRWSLGERLRQAGYRVIEAGTGGQAREHFVHSGAPERRVVLLDLRLPDADGLQLLDELREQQPGWQVIVLSAHATPEIAQNALARGALHVGGKPFDLDDIVRLVDRGFAARPPEP